MCFNRLPRAVSRSLHLYVDCLFRMYTSFWGRIVPSDKWMQNDFQNTVLWMQCREIHVRMYTEFPWGLIKTSRPWTQENPQEIVPSNLRGLSQKYVYWFSYGRTGNLAPRWCISARACPYWCQLDWCFITSLRLRCRKILNNGTLSNSVWNLTSLPQRHLLL